MQCSLLHAELLSLTLSSMDMLNGLVRSAHGNKDLWYEYCYEIWPQFREVFSYFVFDSLHNFMRRCKDHSS
jgi:hypothetical protein